jgi:hypothetical protein
MKSINALIGAASLLIGVAASADVIHFVAFKYQPGVSQQQKADISQRFLELQKVAKKQGRQYILSIVGGKELSREGFDQGLEQAFIVTFENEGDRNFFVGKPYAAAMDPAHEALAKVVEPLLSKGADGAPNGLFVFDLAPGATSARSASAN